MRYWVYINDKVTGPFEEDQIPSLEGFTPDTLICSEVIEEGAAQEWIPASSVLNTPDIVSDNVPEHAISTQTYVAAKDLAKTKSAVLTGEEALLEKISILTREIEELRKDVRQIARGVAAPAQQEQAAAADPFEQFTAHRGEVITPEEKTAVESIAADNTPPEMDVVGDGETPEPSAAAAPEEKIVDSFPASSILPELNEQLDKKPEPEAEAEKTVTVNTLDELLEPVKLTPIILEEVSPAKDNFNQTLTSLTSPGPHFQQEAEVVSSAMDSLYRTPKAKPEPVKEPPVEFEDLITEPKRAEDKPEEVKPAAQPQGEAEKEGLQTKVSNMQEIELNDKTSLISDFIPPSGLDNADNKPKTEAVQEIIAPDFTEAGMANSLHETPVIKRVKPADIKTNPLISASKAAAATPEPTERINLTDQFGVQEEDTSPVPQPKQNGALKKIIILVMAFILIAVLYLGSVFVKVLPDTLGILGGKGSAPVKAAAAPATAASVPVPHDNFPGGNQQNEDGQIISAVQNYILPSGMTLLSAIASKHPESVASVEWSVKPFDAQNYIVSAKVPPISETSLMIIYRFNYMPAARELKPLTSDSKNLLGT